MENKGIAGAQDTRIGMNPIIQEEEELNWETQLKLIRKAQRKAYEAEKERITEQYNVEDKSTEELMADYAKNDLYNEYLVHLAVLTCDQATVEDFILPNGRLVRLGDRKKSRMQEKLVVDENPIYSNELRYATDADTLKYYNISPFWCNCKRMQISREEMINIMKDKDCYKFGVCRHLMKLERRWSNMPMEEGGYLEQTDIYPIVGGSTIEFAERKAQGITMTSVLFCKQGGIIYPKTSGQDKEFIESFEYLTDEEILFVTTIYGEAVRCSEYSWQAIANIIKNRVGTREWSKYTSVSEVIMNTGFDAYTNPNIPFREAEKYFENRDFTNTKIEEMIRIVIPIYRGNVDDITGGAVLYYSPRALKSLHQKNPSKYPNETPRWDFSRLEEVTIMGAENDDFLFYKYK